MDYHHGKVDMPSLLATVLALAAIALPCVQGHSNFVALIHNGQKTGDWEYVRENTGGNGHIPPNTPDFICNIGGLNPTIMARTKTRTVAPGDSVGFTILQEFIHGGPVFAYLSKAPGSTTAAQYKGDGLWFKAYELTYTAITPTDGVVWASSVYDKSISAGRGMKNFTFTLPQNLPPGEYLLRAEHIALHNGGVVGGAQYYPGCAQLKVTGNGNGNPAPLVSLTNLYSPTDPGIVVNVYWPPLTSYTAPGPKTWPNACTDHTPNLIGKPNDGDCTPVR